MLGKVETGGEGGKKGGDGWRASMDMRLNKLWEMKKGWEDWHAAVCGVTKIRRDLATEQQGLYILVCKPINLPHNSE